MSLKSSKTKITLTWVLRVVPALIMLQTLYFKFSGAPESVFIFTEIGMEPWGRYLVGVTELVAGVLLLTKFYEFGALLGAGTIAGAIFFHLTKLGIEVQGDGGYLFVLALIVFVCCTILVLMNLKSIQMKIKLLLFAKK